MIYDPKRVADQLKAVWARKDAGGSAAWIDLPCPECERPVCSCSVESAPARRPVALDDCVERLRMHALADRLGGEVPAFLRAPGSTPRVRRRPAPPPRAWERPRASRSLPVGVLAAIHTVRETAR